MKQTLRHDESPLVHVIDQMTKAPIVRAYVTSDTQQPRIPQRGAVPPHHPYCIMVSNGRLVQGTVDTPAFHRLVANIPSKRAAERIAAKIRRGEDAAAAAFDVLG